MAETNENLIKKIKLGGTTYDLAATQVDASAVQFGEGNKLNSNTISGVSADTIIWTDATGKIPETAISSVPESAITAIPASAISATDIPWESISDLAVTSGDTAKTSGIMTPDQIQAVIDAQIATVYKVKGTHTATVDTDGNINNMPTDAKNGDVWNIALPDGTSSAKLNDQIITNGDNVVYVKSGSSGSWDKLAGSIDTSTMATTAWVESYVSGGEGETTAQTTAKFDSLWKTTTAYINTGLGSANSATNASALWTDIVSTVNSGISDQVWDKVVSGKDDIEVEANSGKLATVGAISGYIYDQIQETVDIASAIPMSGSASGADWGSTTALSSIPNVSAVTSFANNNFIAKQDIRYGGTAGEDAYTLIIDNT